MRLALLLACGLSLLFAALLAMQIVQPPAGSDEFADATGVVPASRVRVQPVTPAATPAPTLHGDEWVATILARPLFTRDRRPVSGPAAAAAADSGGALPRLTGIAITPNVRRAIFAGPDGGKPTVVEEGGTIGGFRIEQIGPAGVKVQGPNGERMVALAFDPTPPQPRVDGDPTQPPPPPQPMAGPPPYPMTPYPQPGQFPPPNFGRPGQQLDPNGQPIRPGFPRPRAELSGPLMGAPGTPRSS